jgi:hypothetical protein
MVMSRDRNAGRGDSVKIDNSSIERVEKFKYLGTMLTDQNSVQEEIRSRFKLGNACYPSVQNLLSSRLLSKNLKIKIYRTITSTTTTTTTTTTITTATSTTTTTTTTTTITITTTTTTEFTNELLVIKCKEYSKNIELA